MPTHFVERSISEPSSVLTLLFMSVCQGVDVLIGSLYLRVLNTGCLGEVFVTHFPEESFAKVLLMLKKSRLPCSPSQGCKSES